MKFKDYLIEEVNKKPETEPRDVVKMCYQASFGAEHLLADIEAAKQYFYDEFCMVERRDVPLYEYISENIARADLGAWKEAELPWSWLFELFVMSAKENCGSMEQMQRNLQIAKETVGKVEGLNDFIEDYIKEGIRPIHHSEKYKEAYKPAYRLVYRKYLRLIPILTAAKKKNGGLIVIDGPAASGKSTMAGELSHLLGAEVVHMDDFFLPPKLRTEQRLAEAGGNVHYERFKEEVLPGLIKGEAFEYRRFDCSIMDYAEKIKMPASKWRIVEGSYSHHPYFGDYGDIRAFAVVDEDVQIARILSRNGEKMAQKFKKLWIPMENRYFKAYNIENLAHIRV